MKSTMKWDKQLDTGIELIDNQHRILYDLANDLNNAFKMGANRQVVDTLFTVIINYSFNHFETEEGYVEGEKEYLAHCVEHYRLLRELHTFAVEFRNRRSGEQDPGEFLEQWLRKHIAEYDKPMLAGPKETAEFPEVTHYESFDDEEPERRRHKRVRYETVLDEDITAHLYNANTLKSGTASVVDLSAGGLKIYTDMTINLDDLLIISCRVGKSFKMKEKVKPVYGRDNFYGVEFIAADEETVCFLTELCGAVQKYRLR